ADVLHDDRARISGRARRKKRAQTVLLQQQPVTGPHVGRDSSPAATRGVRGFSLALCAAVLLGTSLFAQTHFATGQDLQPVYEGWEHNADGTFSMVFGYLNRNYDEELDVPIGPNNTIEPGGDRGQPTHFFNRRQQFMFKVKVPKDWGEKDLVWSVTVR